MLFNMYDESKTLSNNIFENGPHLTNINKNNYIGYKTKKILPKSLKPCVSFQKFKYICNYVFLFIM